MGKQRRRRRNRPFGELAKELGITVPRMGAGLVDDHPDQTATDYVAELGALTEAITAYRRAKSTSVGTTTSRNNPSATCACAPPRRNRVARAVLAAGLIVCGCCETEFIVDEPDSDGERDSEEDEGQESSGGSPNRCPAPQPGTGDDGGGGVPESDVVEVLAAEVKVETKSCGIQPVLSLRAPKLRPTGRGGVASHVGRHPRPRLRRLLSGKCALSQDRYEQVALRVCGLRPYKSADRVSVLVVQGERDPFGRPDPTLRREVVLLAGDHTSWPILVPSAVP